MTQSNAEKARQIIKANQYMTLATVGEDGVPWAAPVYYAFDERFNFFFVSAMDSRHVHDLSKTRTVAAAIFDSRVAAGEGDGVQLQGRARAVVAAELVHALRVYFTRRFLDPRDREKHMDPRKYAHNGLMWFYKIAPTQVFTLDLTVTDVDRRVEVDLTAP